MKSIIVPFLAQVVRAATLIALDPPKSEKYVTYWRVPIRLGRDTLTGQDQQIRRNMKTFA